MTSKPFWVKIRIDEGDDEETIKELKTLISTLRVQFLKDTQSVMSKKIGVAPDSIRKYEEIEGKPYVSLSLIKKICSAYDLQCEITIYKN